MTQEITFVSIISIDTGFYLVLTNMLISILSDTFEGLIKLWDQLQNMTCRGSKEYTA